MTDRIFLSRPCFSLSSHDEMNANLSLAAFQTNAIWNSSTHPVLHVTFLDGTDKQKKWVEHIVSSKLQPLMTDIRFLWNAPLSESHIRISFRKKGQAYSYIGSESLTIPKHKETMNLGWIDDDEDYDNVAFKNTGIVVLHEFGHAIGMIHEHQNPVNNPIVWNKPKVYEDAKKLIHWDKPQVDSNIFMLYGSQELCDIATTHEAKQRFCSGTMTNGSTYDSASMMHYFYPQTWMISGGEGIRRNTDLSDMDKEWIRKMYSKNLLTTVIETFTLEDDKALYRASIALLVLTGLYIVSQMIRKFKV